MNDDRFFNMWFAILFVVSIIVLAVGVWAVVELVNWVTAQ